MARKISKKDNRYLAKLVTGKSAPCVFCLREVDDEITYGKLYAIGDIQCHYFCCLLSCCLIQKGHDEEGLFGFMYPDILAEVERCKKHKCSYCGRIGANLGCSVSVCRKQFHLPCGRDKNAVSLYYGTYKSFCQQHAPKQKIPEHIMAKAQLRKKVDRIKGNYITGTLKLDCGDDSTEQMVCVICYEEVDGFPTPNTFWPPCCGKDAWFHRTCLQRMALSAGMHYLKCPLCNDKESFYDAVVNQGYYVPDRDAAWELEQNAFAEIYERVASCVAERCLCPRGRGHDAENGKWDIKLCLLCGSAGAHAHCIIQSQPLKQEPLLIDQSERSRVDTLILDQSEKITEVDQSQTKELNDLSKANGLLTEGTLSLEQSNTSDQHNTYNQLNTSLARLNTCENSNTHPENSSTTPEYSNTTPDKSNTIPDKSNTIPDKSNTTPDKSNTTPDKSNTTPNKSKKCVRFVCRSCLPAAPEDLDSLASSLEAMIQQEQAQAQPANETRRPVMPSRMSIRRTKGRPVLNRPSTSRLPRIENDNRSSESSNVVSSRLELNLKPPRRLRSDVEPIVWGCSGETKLLSPLKLLEQSFREKMVCAGVCDAVLDEATVDTLRRKFRTPRPASERRRIVDDILNGIFDNLLKDSKQKEQAEDWCSPKKCFNTFKQELQNDFSDSSTEIDKSEGKENDSNVTNTPSKDHRNIKVDTLLSLNKDENIKNDVPKHENVIHVTEHQNYDENVEHFDENMKDDVTECQIVEHNYTENQNVKHNVTEYQNTVEKLNNDVIQYENMKHDDNIKANVEKRQNVEHNDTECQNMTHNVTEYQNDVENLSNDITKHQNMKHNDTGYQNDDENINNDVTEHQSEENMKNIDVSISLDNNDKNIKNKATKCENNNDTFERCDVKQNEMKEVTQPKDSQENLNSSDKVNIESETGTDAKKSPSRKKRKHSRKHRKSLKGVEKTKHSTKNNPIDKQKHRSQSESLTDISILKRLLTEQDLCSQLLLELTTGKVVDKNITTLSNSNNQVTNASSETQKNDDTQSNSTEDPKLTNDSKLCETPKHKSQNTRKHKESSKYSTRILKSQDPKRLSKILKDLETDPKDLKIVKDSNESIKYLKKTLQDIEREKQKDEFSRTDSKSLKTPKQKDEILQTNPKSKTTKHSDKIPKSAQKTEKNYNQSSSPKHSNKTNHETPKDSKSPKLSNKSKSETPKDFDSLAESQINLDKNQESLIDIPKHKTIEMQHDSSLEISENDQHINIDVITVEDSPTTTDSYKKLKVKLPDQLKTCFKFSPIEDSIDKNEIGIDLESFKKEYLSEVDREFKCSFEHKHADKNSPERRFCSTIDFAINAAIKKDTVKTDSKNKKRKLSENGMKLVFDHNVVKRRKTSESDLKLVYGYDKISEGSEGIDKTSVGNNGGKKKTNKDKLRKRETKEERRAKRNKRRSSSDKNIEVTIDSSEKRRVKDKKIKKKIKTKFAIQNDNIKVKIKWKKEEFSLNIESKKQDKKEKKIKDNSKFKQYILQFPEGSSKEVLMKPEKEVLPLKKKYFRNEKSPDNLKQMSIQSFFKVKSEQ